MKPCQSSSATFKILTADDLPEAVTVRPCHKIDERAQVPALDGLLARGSTTPLVASMEEFHTRGTWFLPLGIEEYAALVTEAVRQRQSSRATSSLSRRR